MKSLDHPERRPHEVFIGNYESNSLYLVGLKSKRMGHTAYDVNGNVVNGLYPVFVDKEEYIKNLKDGIKRYPNMADVVADLQESLDMANNL